MAINEKINGMENLDYLQSAVCLADLLHDIRQYQEADLLYIDTIQRLIHMYNKRHPFVLGVKSKCLKNKKFLKGKEGNPCCTIF